VFMSKYIFLVYFFYLMAANFTMMAQETFQLTGITGRHNYWRAEYNISPLKWSDGLAAASQVWANQLAADHCNLKHDPVNQMGENIYASYGGQPTANIVVDSWAEERYNYDIASNSCQAGKVCGHYTQVIWENSKNVGCAVSMGANCQVWVCRYDPPGNYIGQKPFLTK
jgi:pathogenesis-related protein 1